MRFFTRFDNKNKQVKLSTFILFTLLFLLLFSGSIIAAYWQWSKYGSDIKAAKEFNQNLNRNIDIDKLPLSDNEDNGIKYQLLNYNLKINLEDPIIVNHSELYDSPGSEILYISEISTNRPSILLDIGWFPTNYPYEKIINDIEHQLENTNGIKDIQCRIYPYNPVIKKNTQIEINKDHLTTIDDLNKKTADQLFSHYNKKSFYKNYYCVLTNNILGSGTPPYTVDQPDYKYGPYLAYTFQWILFALVFTYLYIKYLLLPQLHLRNKKNI